jgi:hypothetical protein
VNHGESRGLKSAVTLPTMVKEQVVKADLTMRAAYAGRSRKGHDVEYE